MLAIGVSGETRQTIYETYIGVKRKISVLENSESVGKRLIEAFGTNDKQFIAKILGFKTVGGLYKVLSGERELDFEKLLKFRKHTKRTIDWLLAGEESTKSRSVGELVPDLMDRLEKIAHEQAVEVFGDLDIAGRTLDDYTLNLLVEYLLCRALVSLGLVDEEYYPVLISDWDRAKRFTFLANIPQSLDDRIRELVRREKGVSSVAQDDEIRDMIRDIVREEVDASRKRPVYPLRVADATEDETEETTRRKKAG